MAHSGLGKPKPEGSFDFQDLKMPRGALSDCTQTFQDLLTKQYTLSYSNWFEVYSLIKGLPTLNYGRIPNMN